MAEKIAVVAVADEVTVEVPGPGDTPIVFDQFARIKSRVVEEVTAPAAIGHNGRAPPVGEGQGFIAADEILIAVGRESITVVLGVELHEQADLAQVVQATGPLRLRFGEVERGQEQGGENRDDGDDNQQFNQGEGAAGVGAMFRALRRRGRGRSRRSREATALNSVINGKCRHNVTCLLESELYDGRARLSRFFLAP